MPRLTPALARGLGILQLLLEAEDGLTAPETVARSGLPRATVHELLATLVAYDYARRDETGRYHLGLRVFQLGNAYGERIDLVTLGTRVAREVADRCAETINVGVLDGSDVVYMAKIESSQAVRMVSAVGRRVPACCTAVGKALLTALPDDAVSELYDHGAALPRLTPRSIVDIATLLDELGQARRIGTTFESGESTPDVSCAGAPVRDRSGAVVAAMSISVPEMRWIQRPRDEWAGLVQVGAARLSELLGARP